jgi:hypothetical protein
VVVVTEVFANLARTAARARGYDHLQTLVLPHPLETRGIEELKQLANARAAELLGLLVAAKT